MYFKYMSVAFLTNGLGVFGLRILTGAGLGQVSDIQYISLWYLSGCIIAALAYFWHHRAPLRREVLVGFAMAVCSVFGQLGMSLSLSRGLPGFVVFPTATGGGLLFVVVVGIRLFRDPMGRIGYLGIATGTMALILLALP